MNTKPHMAGIYLSGTGNTRYCVEKLISLVSPSSPCVGLEEENAVGVAEENDVLCLGYPTQFSNAPFLVQDFIHRNKELWAGKQVFCLVTMGAFSGDGAGCAARLLKRYGATILGGVHIPMPDSVCDSKLLKKTREQNQAILDRADQKIERIAQSIAENQYPQEGLSPFSHILGLLGQRLWYYKKTRRYSNRLNISDACIGCGTCVKLCPTKNLELIQKKAAAHARCTMCYRCISLCPQKAITLLGKTVIEQHRLESYRSYPHPLPEQDEAH